MKKLVIIKKAFRKLKLSGAGADPSIPQYPDALIDLEDMMAEWDNMPSVNTGYNLTGDNADLSEESGLSISDANAVSLNLAIHISVDYGVEVMPQVAKQARAGLSDLVKRGATIPTVKYHNRMPRGLGNTYREYYAYNRSFYPNTAASSDAFQYKENSFVDWTVDFTPWLLGDVLTAVVWKSQQDKITITNETNTNSLAQARLTFDNIGTYKVEITATTANGQVVETLWFNVGGKIV